MTKDNMFWIPMKGNKVNVKVLKPVEKVAIFQDALRISLVMGQAFSLMPVLGIGKKKASNIKFVKTSWKCAYALISVTGQIFLTTMCLYKVYYDPTLKAATTLIFYATNCITMVMFLNMARGWPKLVQEVAKTEELDPNFDHRLVYRCNITCSVFFIVSLIEHILSLLSAFSAAHYCYPTFDTYHGFVKHFYPWVFDFLPYHPLLGLMTQLLHFQATFTWNYSDLFVIIMSYYLTSRLEQVNKKLHLAQGQYLPEPFWRSIREEYGRATQLVRKVDDAISGVIFISFSNNLIFICFQLFNTLESGFTNRVQCAVKNTTASPLKGFETALYFCFSLVYVIFRSVAVSLIAAQVNTTSTVPAPVLYDVPSPVYCIEVQRFLDQVHGEKVALSGLQFFSITRGLLLTVAGTIVTYELVMVQFNAPSAPPLLGPLTTLPTFFNATTVT